MCEHQFFEVKNLSYSPIEEMEIAGKMQTVMGWQREGKQVMCALCAEERQLWANGDLLIMDEKGYWVRVQRREGNK